MAAVCSIAALAVAGCLALSACGSAGRDASPGAEDAARTGVVSATVDAAEAPRVVALSKSLGELWLLAGGELAGATEDAFELDAVSEGTVAVGTISKPNPEAILALSPDTVMITGSIPAQKELAERLIGAGIEVLEIEINSFDDYDAVMRDLTARTGRDDLYAQNVTAVGAGIDEVLARVPGVAQESAPTYLALRVSSAKNTALKSDHFACAMIDDMGLRNIADDDSALDEPSLEAIAAEDPAYIFIILQGDEDRAREAFQSAFAEHPVWGALSAVREDRVLILPKEYFQYKPNARWAEAYEYLYGVLFEAE